MDIFMEYLKCFVVGGLICLIGQILLDRTQLTNGKIMVLFLVAGAVLQAIGVYGPIVEFAGAGATVPISGFGYALAKGAIEEVKSSGIMGAFSGGLAATASGITAAIVFGYLAALLANPKSKS
ncbi:stage V sporulation protein AE [Cellulosilyticum lentocellum]|uniref:Stage V sporulation protein AE n=2 Tax=Cellulosilyticum TaxID=698776 RepID=F2JHK2_CELLD|nr:stage V sporulation protein AE [Cellulosilyticum lentocellum]ADZ84241.1 stage V sporulation protein AE [Cellulosilyticum lentocellum DSM 5427]